ncbi:hypothetical protein [Stenotrophomonas sp. TWI587]|uniref:hypothetical protein n=1 Tax=Stenotrophomonas sp. TWI587 TaxID=3136783 RepID=UPI00320A6305
MREPIESGVADVSRAALAERFLRGLSFLRYTGTRSRSAFSMRKACLAPRLVA